MTQDASVATLEAKFDMLADSMAALTTAVEKNNEKLERLAVLEVSHNNSSKAIERAFTAISNLESDIDEHIKANAEDHNGYSKWVWVATGFCVAVSVMWTVVGYRMNAMIDDSTKAIYEMRLHIAEDKMKSPEDVRLIMKEK